MTHSHPSTSQNRRSEARPRSAKMPPGATRPPSAAQNRRSEPRPGGRGTQHPLAPPRTSRNPPIAAAKPQVKGPSAVGGKVSTPPTSAHRQDLHHGRGATPARPPTLAPENHPTRPRSPKRYLPDRRKTAGQRLALNPSRGKTADPQPKLLEHRTSRTQTCRSEARSGRPRKYRIQQHPPTTKIHTAGTPPTPRPPTKIHNQRPQSTSWRHHQDPRQPVQNPRSQPRPRSYKPLPGTNPPPRPEVAP
jgi:hypothetical protein